MVQVATRDLEPIIELHVSLLSRSVSHIPHLYPNLAPALVAFIRQI